MFCITSTSDQIEVVGSLLMLKPFLKGENTCLRNSSCVFKSQQYQVVAEIKGVFNFSTPLRLETHLGFTNAKAATMAKAAGKAEDFDETLDFWFENKVRQYATTVDGRYHAPNDVVNIPILYRVS